MRKTYLSIIFIKIRRKWLVSFTLRPPLLPNVHYN